MEESAVQAWWATTKADESKLAKWLQRQYRGERMAAARLRQVVERFGSEAPERQRGVVELIAGQEGDHAEWILRLLQARNIEVPADLPAERYWPQVEGQVTSWDTACAVAAHAEGMRLARIRVIANDSGAPDDIRETFARILPQEEFHERAFRAFATDDALGATKDNHEEGAAALGLVS